MTKNKYYAIKKPITKIVTSWDECKTLVSGVKGVQYKSFTSLEDAKAYIDETTSTTTTNKPADVLDADYVGVRIFVDGSFNPKTKTYGGSAIFIDDNKEEIGNLTVSGTKPEFVTARNVSGEILATTNAITQAIKLGYKDVTIIHDYEGIAHWATGVWHQTNSTIAKYYVHEFLPQVKDQINIRFIWVKGHTNVKYNEQCDILAKQACGVIA